MFGEWCVADMKVLTVGDVGVGWCGSPLSLAGGGLIRGFGTGEGRWPCDLCDWHVAGGRLAALKVWIAGAQGGKC